MDKLRLHGFNNLSKSLSFKIYDICHARAQKQAYIAYIDDVFNADRLTQILTEISDIIDAQILNVAQQNYEPEGASVTRLIAEEYAYEDALIRSYESDVVTSIIGSAALPATSTA